MIFGSKVMRSNTVVAPFGQNTRSPLVRSVPARQLAPPRVCELVRHARLGQTGCEGTNMPPRLGGSGQAQRPYCPMWTGGSLLYHLSEPGRDEGGGSGERAGLDYRIGHLWPLRMTPASSNAPCLRC